MAQQLIWEKEYQNPQLVTGGEEPLKDVRNFLKFLRKKGSERNNLKILDLGSGSGKNANYLAELGNEVVGLEISKTAIKIASENATARGVGVRYINQSIGDEYPFPDNDFDLAIDVTSSNSLNEEERNIYLAETKRVLKPGAYFFVRALCLDGDKNAKNLLKMFPGKEKDTYLIKEMGLIERVFSEKDFRDLYSDYFEIIALDKKSSYAKFGNQSYKRNYWLAYLRKR
ncbi:MAG: hypothetical protein UT48_C0010G0069 [Parcubacteria group bacterium GW2011_GWE2_39_37]|nr:MAG: hypothetical protein UT48_C0010G0069 [Parcubacteria group bacterium GW2011_GWE2_39_37]